MNAVSKMDKNAPDVKVLNEAPPLAMTPVQAPEILPALKKKRRGGRFLVMAALPLALITGGAYVWVTGGRYQETENANLRQARVMITSEAAGRITDVSVADSAIVKAGDVLFMVDAEPYRIALSQADASLAAARLSVEQLRAAYSQAIAQESIANGEVDYAKAQFDRATDLAGKGINTQSALDEARRDLDKAREEQTAARQGIASARAALGGDPDIETDKHPAVLQALAARDKAAYDLAQTTVRAPASGMVAQASSVKVGQFVAAGTPVFSLVETGDTWVEANFKETQLTNMKPGQSADITLDTYPGRPFHATVQSIGAGTGAEFSLLPAQNATGNWVKVTQRIPVRLKVDDPDANVALRTGMSASVTVDTGVSRGWPKIFGAANAAE
ncbi:MAG: HlyD family secretion protein [Mesorhizobium sp.]|jgi:membrane fusion protein (multidrug efflux system)